MKKIDLLQEITINKYCPEPKGDNNRMEGTISRSPHSVQRGMLLGKSPPKKSSSQSFLNTQKVVLRSIVQCKYGHGCVRMRMHVRAFACICMHCACV